MPRGVSIICCLSAEVAEVAEAALVAAEVDVAAAVAVAVAVEGAAVGVSGRVCSIPSAW